mmetsp:Transcript_73688/g.216242  ORF Transcript_73688/g.216242 Transcript_73688/m.216242 type:complete len:201 (+) Transcript_73688:1079-1681(+)
MAMVFRIRRTPSPTTPPSGRTATATAWGTTRTPTPSTRTATQRRSPAAPTTTRSGGPCRPRATTSSAGARPWSTAATRSLVIGAGSGPCTPSPPRSPLPGSARSTRRTLGARPTASLPPSEPAGHVHSALGRRGEEASQSRAGRLPARSRAVGRTSVGWSSAGRQDLSCTVFDGMPHKIACHVRRLSHEAQSLFLCTCLS